MPRQYTPSITLTCEQCGTAFKRKVGKTQPYDHHFCCGACYQQHARDRRSSECSLICDHCGTSFSRKRSEAVASKRHYCSGTCHMAAKKAAKPTHDCARCGRTFRRKASRTVPYPNNYCSQACYHESQITRVERVCEECGNTFTKTPSKVARYDGKRGGIYCSPACLSTSQRRQVTLRCETCDGEFAVPQVRAEKAKYCSRACDHIAKVKRVDRICAVCGNVYQCKPSSRTHHCSRACGNVSTSKPKIQIGCQHCGTTFDVWPSLAKRQFCSPKCRYAFQRAQNRAGRGTARYNEWRAEVFERAGYRCEDCGTLSGPKQAHHIQPWAKFPALRYDISNGMCLCQSCHSNRHPTYAIMKVPHPRQRSA